MKGGFTPGFVPGHPQGGSAEGSALSPADLVEWKTMAGKDRQGAGERIAMHALDFLKKVGKARQQPIYVLFGEELFLKRQVITALKARFLGEGEDGFSYSTHAGDRAVYADIHDELRTLPFLSKRRVVVIDNADKFVSNERDRLEKYLGAPSTTGILILNVKSWTSTTKLARKVPDEATIDCKSPPAASLIPWCTDWCQARHGKHLAPQAARLLVNLVGSEMGVLDQELLKLATYVGEAGRIEAAEVDRLVGNSREQNTFTIFDLISSGQTGKALAHLDRLFIQGEDPLGMLGAFSWQLRFLARAARLGTQGVPLQAALARVGIPPFNQRRSEQLLRHLGLARATRLYDWLLETDQGLKGYSQLPPRVLLERLVVRLARGAGAVVPRGR
jgi:DNA polymerase-3 subunit delta